MRAGLALVAIVFAAGCQSTRLPDTRETRAELPTHQYVTIARLADRLELQYLGDSDGYIELSTPPDHIMLIRDSRSALINGERLSLGDPCMRRGSEYVVSEPDAELVKSTLTSQRAGREPPSSTPKPLRISFENLPPAGLPAAWRPRAGVTPRDWRAIVIHHTAAPRGSAKSIHKLHLSNGWDGLGYHFVIGNGTETRDGEIEAGYRWIEQLKGAHARARPGDDNRWNLHSIGICLVGDFTHKRPSQRQMDALVRLVRALMAEYEIPRESVVPHHFVHSTECPGLSFPWDEFMARLR